MLEVVRETVNRYGQHRAFGGLAISLSSDGFTQLPPLDWALDDATISRFEQATGITIAATGPERFAARYEVLSNQYEEASQLACRASRRVLWPHGRNGPRQF